MDNGWAIVLGALIALTGSSIVPWAREAITRRSEHKRSSEAARQEAVIQFIDANSRTMLAHAFKHADQMLQFGGERYRAGATVLLSASPEDRSILTELLRRSDPIAVDKTSGISLGGSARAVQVTLIEWVDRRLEVDDMLAFYAARAADLA